PAPPHPSRVGTGDPHRRRGASPRRPPRSWSRRRPGRGPQHPPTPLTSLASGRSLTSPSWSSAVGAAVVPASFAAASVVLASSAAAAVVPAASADSNDAGSSEETDKKGAVVERLKVQAIKKDIKQSPKKVNLVAKLVRGMRVEDALLQLQVTVKRAAKSLYQVIHSARANAAHNHGLDPDKLIVEEAFVGKGLYLKRLS
ncbi:unnamed protein product, partial [Urochloa humidicola]